MRMFAGIVRFGPFGDSERDRAALNGLARADKRPFAIEQAGNAVFMAMGEGGGVGLQARPARGGLSVGRAFLHNTEDVARQLNLPAQNSHAALAQSAFEACGDAGLATLRGGFAFARWHEQRRELTLVRDCGRGDGLYFYRGADFVIFASHLSCLVAHPDVPRELDEVVLASFLANNRLQRRRTMFRGIERVPTRSVLTLTGADTVQRYYWSPRIRSAPVYSRDEDYIERGRELLDQAVARVVGDSPKFAVVASGGLDSSAIVTTLARRGLPSIDCYTLVPEDGTDGVIAEGNYADERPKTALLSGRYPALRFRNFATSDLRPYACSDDSYFNGWPIPSFNTSRARLSEPLFGAIAADGLQVVLIGAAGNLGLSWNGANLLPELARHGRILTLLREAQATAVHQKSTPWRVLARELVLPALPAWAGKASLLLRSPAFRRRYAQLTMNAGCPLRPEIVAELDLPRAMQEDGFALRPYRRWRTRQERAERLFDRAYPAHDARAMAEARYGIEIRDPLADRDLLEFALNVPEHLYRRNGVPRWLMRAVLADRVPAEILGEPRRGARGTNWFAVMSGRRAEIAEEVERMETSLAASRLFDIPRLKRLVDNWPKSAADAERQYAAYMLALDQAVHVFRFMRWVARGNA